MAIFDRVPLEIKVQQSDLHFQWRFTTPQWQHGYGQGIAKKGAGRGICPPTDSPTYIKCECLY